MRSKPEYRIRSTSKYGWLIDRKWLFLWLPVGRWIHQDWWCPFQFETASEAEAFVAGRQALSEHSDGH